MPDMLMTASSSTTPAATRLACTSMPMQRAIAANTTTVPTAALRKSATAEYASICQSGVSDINRNSSVPVSCSFRIAPEEDVSPTLTRPRNELPMIRYDMRSPPYGERLGMYSPSPSIRDIK